MGDERNVAGHGDNGYKSVTIIDFIFLGYKLIEADLAETEEKECESIGLETIESMPCRCTSDNRCNGEHVKEESTAIIVSPNPFAGGASAVAGDASVSMTSFSSSTLTSQSSLPGSATQIPSSTSTPPPSQFFCLYLNLFRLLKPFLCPPSLATFLGLLVGFVPPLKMLFVGTPPGLGTKPNDGPALGFIWEAAGFIGEYMLGSDRCNSSACWCMLILFSVRK